MDGGGKMCDFQVSRNICVTVYAQAMTCMEFWPHLHTIVFTISSTEKIRRSSEIEAEIKMQKGFQYIAFNI